MGEALSSESKKLLEVATNEHADRTLRLWALFRTDIKAFAEALIWESREISGVTSSEGIYDMAVQQVKRYRSKKSRKKHKFSKVREVCLDDYFLTARGVATIKCKNSSIPNLNYINNSDYLIKRIALIHGSISKLGSEKQSHLQYRYANIHVSVRQVSIDLKVDEKYLGRLVRRARTLCADAIWRSI